MSHDPQDSCDFRLKSFFGQRLKGNRNELPPILGVPATVETAASSQKGGEEGQAGSWVFDKSNPAEQVQSLHLTNPTQ